MTSNHRRSAFARTAVAVLLLASVLTACVGGAGSTGTPSGPTPIPPGLTASPDSTASPGSTAPPGLTASPGSTTPPPSATAAALVTTPDQAARRVLALDSRFRGIRQYDPNLVGAAAWYTVTPVGDGFRVVVRIGWGDCPSGCIDEHTWTYDVARTGEVVPVGEAGPSAPSGVIGGAAGTPGVGALGVSGRATAGPTCPVMRNPPDPACADRPVAGAVLVITDDGGREIARATSDANGDFAVELTAGHYVLTPGPVAGLMGTAAPIDFTIASSGAAVTLVVQYDTGIR